MIQVVGERDLTHRADADGIRRDSDALNTTVDGSNTVLDTRYNVRVLWCVRTRRLQVRHARQSGQRPPCRLQCIDLLSQRTIFKQQFTHFVCVCVCVCAMIVTHIIPSSTKAYFHIAH
jgi:hypothetical protein